MNEKKTVYQITFTPDEYEAIKMHLNAFGKDDACSRYDWCGEYSDNCSKCPCRTLFEKIKEADK